MPNLAAPMTPEQWREVESVLEAALDRPEDGREAWAREQCPDPVIRREVLQLLAAMDKGQDFLDAPARVYAADLIASSGETGLPEQIGPYRPVRELGRGGMGAVFLAERADGQFEHRVALKVLGRRYPSDHMRRRFMAERQILASLNHPGIARLYDGGMADDQVPYFAMEYVDGRPIDAYCREENISLRERLRLFLQACDAVTYAHGMLVVHRDLKPSNILIEEKGGGSAEGARVKLLDFGIAKLLDADDSPAAVPLTVTGMHLMTPEYASPEQLRGEAVTAASDVYQLGVLLFGLLTGRRLYDFAGRSITEIARIVTTEDVPRPSTSVGENAGYRAGPEQVRRQLRGDLDAIVRKAVRKEPESRYESVDRLAADIRRYLERRPVTAHEGTVAYRARKYVRRHRWAIAGVLVALLAVAGYAVSITALQARTERQRDRAEQYADFLTDLFSSPDPFNDTPGNREITIREFFDQAVERVRSELGDDPAMQASLLSTIAGVYKSLDFDRQAYALYDEVVSIHDRMGELRSEPAIRALRQMAWLTGDEHRADSLYDLQLRLARQLEGGVGPITARSLIPYGSWLEGRGRIAEAESTMMRAESVLKDAGPEFEEDLAGARFFLGQIRRSLGKFVAADSSLRLAYASRADELGPEHPRVAIIMTELGMVAENLGNLEEAERWKRAALRIFETNLGPEHTYTVTQMNNVAMLLGAQGKKAEAEALMRRVLEIRERQYGPDHSATTGTLQNVATLIMQQGRYDEAEPLFEDVRSRYERSLPERHHLRAFPLLSLIEVNLGQGDPVTAERYARAALRELTLALPDDHPLLPIARSRLGETLLEQHRLAEAEPLIVESYHELQAIDGYEDRKASARRRLVALYDALGRPEDAPLVLPAPGDSSGS